MVGIGWAHCLAVHHGTLVVRRVNDSDVGCGIARHIGLLCQSLLIHQQHLSSSLVKQMLGIRLTLGCIALEEGQAQQRLDSRRSAANGYVRSWLSACKISNTVQVESNPHRRVPGAAMAMRASVS